VPSYWIQPEADITTPLPEDEHRHELSENFYGLVGAGYTALFDAFPPIFTQIQQLAGVDIDALLPLYVGMHLTDHADLPAEIERVAKDLVTVQSRFRALHDALLSRTGWERALIISDKGYVPERAYFEHFAGRPRPVREPWELDTFEGEDEPSFGADLRHVLRYLDHAQRHGGTRFWFVGR
jgi:hypothetical protein